MNTKKATLIGIVVLAIAAIVVGILAVAGTFASKASVVIEGKSYPLVERSDTDSKVFRYEPIYVK